MIVVAEENRQRLLDGFGGELFTPRFVVNRPFMCRQVVHLESKIVNVDYS